MAGSVALASARVGGGITRHRLTWVSDAAGVVSGNAVSLPTGELLQVGYTPDGGGTAPTDLYDLTMTDPDGADALAGTGANLSGTVAAKVVPVISTSFRRWFWSGSYTLVAANAGNAKGGTVDLYMR